MRHPASNEAVPNRVTTAGVEAARSFERDRAGGGAAGRSDVLGRDVEGEHYWGSDLRR